MEAKGNIVDLISNEQVDLWNHEELKHGYFEQGCLYLGAKEAIGPLLNAKHIGAVLTIMDRKSYLKENIGEKMGNYGLAEDHLFIDS